jgi:hypothetical protein
MLGKEGIPMANESRKARSLLLEGAMVVASVLFALAVDSRYERHEEEARARQAMEAIIAEVRLNLAELIYAGERIDRSMRLLDSIGKQLPTSTTFYPYLLQFDGFYTPDIQDAAWTFASQQSYMTLLPRGFVSGAYAVYDLEFDLLESQIETFATSPLVHTPGKARVAHSIAGYLEEEDRRWVRFAILEHRKFLEVYGDLEPNVDSLPGAR